MSRGASAGAPANTVNLDDPDVDWRPLPCSRAHGGRVINHPSLSATSLCRYAGQGASPAWLSDVIWTEPNTKRPRRTAANQSRRGV